MPAWRLSDEGRLMQKYDVASTDLGTAQHYVGHVMLSLDRREEMTQANASIDVVHMNPMFCLTSTYPIEAIGTADLDEGQSNKIKVFVDKLTSEYNAHHRRQRNRRARFNSQNEFTILPFARPPVPERPFWRFSCAGFILKAYQMAGITLIDCNSDSFPNLTLDEIKEAYPGSSSRLDNSDFRREMGLDGDGPWPVVLAGYVMNAFNRESDDIQNNPYLPSTGDSYFSP